MPYAPHRFSSTLQPSVQLPLLAARALITRIALLHKAPKARLGSCYLGTAPRVAEPYKRTLPCVALTFRAKQRIASQRERKLRSTLPSIPLLSTGIHSRPFPHCTLPIYICPPFLCTVETIFGPFIPSSDNNIDPKSRHKRPLPPHSLSPPTDITGPRLFYILNRLQLDSRQSKALLMKLGQSLLSLYTNTID